MISTSKQIWSTNLTGISEDNYKESSNRLMNSNFQFQNLRVKNPSWFQTVLESISTSSF